MMQIATIFYRPARRFRDRIDADSYHETTNSYCVAARAFGQLLASFLFLFILI